MRKYLPGTRITTKAPIIKELAKNTDIPLVQASFIYDVIWNVVLKRLKAGHDIILPGIGRFQFVPVRERKSNMTGQIIPPHKRIRFNPNVNLALFIRVNTREYKIR